LEPAALWIIENKQVQPIPCLTAGRDAHLVNGKWGDVADFC